MASSEVDQKFLGRLSKLTEASNPLLSSSLYQILGLSILLSKRLVRARKLRKLDTSRDTKSLSLYHHIIWLSREGLTVLETYVLPYTQDEKYGPELRVLAAKLRASFYHIFCLFHNNPPVSHINVPTFIDPTTPRRNNGPTRRKSDGSPSNNRSRTSKDAHARVAALRETIPSIASEASYITNPYAAPPGGSPPPAGPPGLPPISVPHPSAFILPPLNFVPLAATHFTTASTLASTLLPGSHPLRLSVALEHTAFLWDCTHDHDGARRLARRAIRDVYRAQEGMNDAEFADAAELVGVLGRMMRRKSQEATPRVGVGSGALVGSPPPGGSGSGSGERGDGGVPPVPQVRGLGVTTGVGRERAGTHEGAARGDSTVVAERERTSGGGSTTAGAERRSARGSGGSGHRPGSSKESTPRVGGNRSSGGSASVSGGSKETTPRAAANRMSGESTGSTTPRAAQGIAVAPAAALQDTSQYRSMVDRRR